MEKEFKGVRVLVLEGYARQSLPMIKAFKKLGCIVSALCDSKLDVAYVSRYTDHKILGICSKDREAETTEQIRNLLKTGEFDVVVPTVDFSACILSKNKEEFSNYAIVLSNDWEVYVIAGDKEKTMQICTENNIPCPITVFNAESVDDVLNSGICFPIAMKPKVGYGAIGFRRLNDKAELLSTIDEISEPINTYVFQEFIPQTELQYECAMFIDDKNNVKTACVFSKNRWFPVSGGSSTLNITVDRPDIIDSCTKLLKAINWRGAADIDLIQDPRDGIAKVMEINPRVSGSVKIVFISGPNQAKQMLELAYKKEVSSFFEYKKGQRLRCSQIDLLWFLKSPNRFKSKPSWFSPFHTADHTFSLDDPLPWFAFLIGGMKSFKRKMKERGC